MRLSTTLCLGLLSAYLPLFGGAAYWVRSSNVPYSSATLSSTIDHVSDGPIISGDSWTFTNPIYNRGTTADYSAYVSFGKLGLQMSMSSYCLDGSCGVEGISTHNMFLTSNDSITVGLVGGGGSGFNGTLRINYRFDGSLYNSGSGVGSSAAYLNVGSGTTWSSAYAVIEEGFQLSSTGGNLSANSTGGWDYLAEGTAEIAITNGFANVVQQLRGTAYCLSYVGQSCSAGLDFLNSAILGGAVVLDASGQVVDDATITASSGYDYTRALPSLVPEPAHYVTLAIGFMGLAAAMRRRQPARIRG